MEKLQKMIADYINSEVRGDINNFPSINALMESPDGIETARASIFKICESSGMSIQSAVNKYEEILSA